MLNAWFMANAKMTIAAINTKNANPVSGNIRRAAAGGNCPVIIKEGMIAWAVNMVRAMVRISGTYIHINVSHMWTSFQLALVSALGSSNILGHTCPVPFPDSVQAYNKRAENQVKIITALYGCQGESVSNLPLAASKSQLASPYYPSV